MRPCKSANATILAPILVALLPTASFAQSTDAGAPIGDHARSAPIQAEITAGTESKTASIKLDLLQLETLTSGSPGASATLNNSALAITVSTPFDGDQDAQPANLEGLTNGTTIGLEYSFYSSKKVTGVTPEMERIVAQASAECVRRTNLTFLADQVSLGPQPSAEAVQALVDRRAQNLLACDITQTDGQTLVDTYLPGMARRYATQFFARDSFAIGLRGQVSFDDFNYVDPLTLAKKDTRKTGWSAGVRATNYFRASPTALTGSIDYEESYEAADKLVLCPAGATTGPVTCVNDPVGPPTRDHSAIARLNLRHRFLGKDGPGHLAISPTLSYDISDNVFGAELPVYFIPGGDDLLTGGAKVGYRTDTKDVTFGIFIGKAFGLSD